MRKTTTNSPHLYTLERQAPPNKKTNKNKQSHLIDLSSFYHMERENNRPAPIHSNTQQCTVITCKLGLRQPIRIIDEMVP